MTADIMAGHPKVQSKTFCLRTGERVPFLLLYVLSVCRNTQTLSLFNTAQKYNLKYYFPADATAQSTYSFPDIFLQASAQQQLNVAQ